MKLNYNHKKNMLMFVFILICITFIIITSIIIKNVLFIILMFLFCIILFFIHWSFNFLTQKQFKDILAQVSESIASLYNMNKKLILSDFDNTILSKIQSQIVKLEGIMTSQNERLKTERDEIKSLISDISHQLKIPFSNLQMYCELFQDNTLSELQRIEFAKNFQSQLEKLNWLMESMIKMSRLESGIIQLSPVNCNINTSILTAIKQAYLKAEEKNIDIKFNYSKDNYAICDFKWTTEAVFNILDNAIKYTDVGSVEIDIYTYEIYVRIDIKDTGCGIAEEEVNRIFKRFYRVSKTSGIDGVGIGLYLAKKIIMNQDGYIKVTSKVGEGSIFSIFLPTL